MKKPTDKDKEPPTPEEQNPSWMSAQYMVPNLLPEDEEDHFEE